MTDPKSNASRPQRIFATVTILAFFIGLGPPFFLCPLSASGLEGFTVDDSFTLTSITVRTGKSTRIFDGRKLISGKIMHYQSLGGVTVAVRGGIHLPNVNRAELLGPNLAAGTPNPGATAKPLAGTADAGIAVQFDAPIANQTGPDLVIFELHKGTGNGDPFHIAALEENNGWHGITVTRYDVNASHPASVELPALDLYRHASAPHDTPSFLKGSLVNHTRSEDGFRAIATAIDLSDLGVPVGEKVSGIVLRSVLNQPTFDPLATIGIPSVSEETLLTEAPAGSVSRRASLSDRAMAGPLKNCEEIIFAQRVSGTDHWYGNFGHYSDGHQGHYAPASTPKSVDYFKYAYGNGGRLCRYNLRTRQLTVLLDDPAGGIRDPHVHYDGNKVLFSYRPGGTKAYHLYEISSDGTNLRQLTDGPDNDIEPIYAPDGSIIFCSSRCHRFVPCWKTQVATLYRCNGDGSEIRMLSNNAEQENTPWMLPDGRVLYMRWEYVDRNQLLYHHLWTINPDGTSVMVYFGNQHPGDVMIDAKPIPNSRKIVASFSPAHGLPEHMGYITIVDPQAGPDDMSMARRVSSARFRDPYPLSDDLFLVADPNGIHLLAGDGRTETLYSPPDKSGRWQCHEPRPLRARQRERVIPSRFDASENSGYLVLSDVYAGRNMAGVEPGEIKKLLVLEQLPKPVNFSGGSEPLTVGGTFTLQRVLGTVPVEEDGSAYFEVPALRSLFFVALNEQEMSVKRMQSFVTVQPGETTSCVGCHEQRNQAPHARDLSMLRAVQREPSQITRYDGIPDVLDFPRDIQPILDRHCVQCHNHDRHDADINFSGDRTPYYSTAYWTMFSRSLVVDGRNKYGNRPPRTIGSSASRLMTCLDKSHYGVQLDDRERNLIRIWIESGATYSGTYACLGCGMFPVDFPEEIIRERCGTCHQAKEESYRNVKKGAFYYQFGNLAPPQPLLEEIDDIILIRHLAYFQLGEAPLYQAMCNLDHPSNSLFLRAPLAKSAGGLELCGQPVFGNTRDPDYQEMLARIQAASRRLQQEKRFDMPGFRPNRYYIREMQSIDILPEDLPPDARVDAYATDQAYWRSLQVTGDQNPEPITY
jgi:hypothetical protein